MIYKIQAMKASRKKIAIVAGAVIAVLLTLTITTPYLFKDKIINAILSEAGKNINAHVKFSDVSFSLIRNFPNLRVSLDDVVITGKGDFKGDTLANIKHLNGVIALTSLWSDDGYRIRKIIVNEPVVHLIVNKDGKRNWDIIKQDDKKKSSDKKPFKLSLKELKIKDGSVTYDDYRDGVSLSVGKINHKTSGDFSDEMNNFETENEFEDAYLKVGKIVWLNNYKIELDAKFKADTQNNRYEISDNTLNINELRLSLNGWFKIVDKSLYDMDLSASAEECQFKDILSLIPAIHTKKFEDIETKGLVRINGYAKGQLDTRTAKTLWPSFGFDIDVKNSSFKYPELPKSVDNINLKCKISNNGGSIDNTIVDISKFSLVMADAPFGGRLKITHPASDPNINLYAKGRINLSRIKEFYPLDKDQKLEGTADIDLTIDGSMSYYKKKMYDRFKFSGSMTMSNMKFNTPSLSHPLQIISAKMNFTSRYIDVPVMKIRVGGSDLQANGHLDNVISYVFQNDTLKGSLNTTSSYLNISDLLTTADGTQSHESSKAKGKKTSNVIVLPQDMNLTMASTFNHITFDKIDITNARGQFTMSNGRLRMKGISLNSMGGTMTLNGEYASDAATPRLKGDVNIDNVLYSEVFRQITSARKLVPIFGKTKGRFHGNATFDTPLESDMKPNLTQLRAKGTISSNDITISGVEALHRLSKALKRDEFYDPEISHVSIPFEVKDGKVLTSNFSFYIADTKFNVENGYTSINENIDYTMHVDIPTSESTILKINKAGVRITGTISDPKVKVQTKEMIKEAGRTIKNNISTTVKTAANDIKEEWKEERAGMKEDWKESKENLKEDMKEAGSEIKNAFRSLFKKNQD